MLLASYSRKAQNQHHRSPSISIKINIHPIQSTNQSPIQIPHLQVSSQWQLFIVSNTSVLCYVQTVLGSITFCDDITIRVSAPHLATCLHSHNTVLHPSLICPHTSECFTIIAAIFRRSNTAEARLTYFPQISHQ